METLVIVVVIAAAASVAGIRNAIGSRGGGGRRGGGGGGGGGGSSGFIDLGKRGISAHKKGEFSQDSGNIVRVGIETVFFVMSSST